MRIEPMNHAYAMEYINWKYTPPYEFYNIPPGGVEETLEEIFGTSGMDYYSVLDEDGSLFGMYVYSFCDGTMNIGLGIRPASCGQGNGNDFVRTCISFGREKYAYTGVIRLMAADFNLRAIHLYCSVGFAETGRVDKLSYGTPVTFVLMESEKV